MKMKKLSKFLLLLPIVGILFSPISVFAQDQRCFTKKECVDKRRSMGLSDAEAEKGFYSGFPDSLQACGASKVIGTETFEVGFCLPAGKTTTQVSFGGNTEFNHIGELIQFGYRYGVIAASIISIIVIIVAGLMWTVSGGNSSTIESAKKRIAGALTGLILIVLSYTILYSINPNLVAFRLPQTWLLNTINTPDAYCNDFTAGTLISKDPLSKELLEGTRAEKNQAYTAANISRPKDTATCGEEYFFESGNGFTCKGNFCERKNNKGYVCYEKDPGEGEDCYQAMIAGSISAPEGLFCKGDLAESIIDENLELMVICKDGSIHSTKKFQELPAGARSYIFHYWSGIDNACAGSNQGVAGFYFEAEINDERGGAGGNLCPGNPFTFGTDDFHAIGRSTKGSSQCDINLGILAATLADGKAPDCSGDDAPEDNCGAEALKPHTRSEQTDPTNLFAIRHIEIDRMKKIVNNPEFTDHLFTKDELFNGTTCNIVIDRSQFPALDGG